MSHSSPQNHPRILLIVPAYNESESIVKVSQTIRKAGYDFIVVNDGSTDNTLEICKANGIPVINLSANLGIGGAVQTGHMYALEQGYDIDIQFDGDGQHDICSVPVLVDAIRSGANLVIGSRFISKDDSNFQSTGLRRLGIKWLSAVIKFVAGVQIHDVTSGFRACDKNAIRLFSQDYPIDYPEPESIVSAVKHHLTVEEVPAKMNRRQSGRSSIRAFSSMYYMIKVSLAIMIQGFTRYGRIKEK